MKSPHVRGRQADSAPDDATSVKVIHTAGTTLGLLEGVARLAVRLADVQAAVIYRLDAPRRPQVVARVGIDGTSAGRGAASDLASVVKPVTIPDASSTTIMLDDPFVALGYAHLSAVPLSHGPHQVGTLVLLDKTPRADPFDSESLDLVARQAAAHLARLAQERAPAADPRAATDLLREASDVLGASLDPQATLEGLARLVVPRIGDWCAIDVLEGDMLRRSVVAHSDAAPTTSGPALGPARALDDAGTVGRVVRTRDPLRVPPHDAAALDPSFRGEARSGLCVPLEGRQGVLGVLSIGTARGDAGEIDDINLDIACRLARRASVAYENARAYAEAESARERMSSLVDDMEAIVWEADAKTFRFSFVSQHAEKLLGFPASKWLDQPTFWADTIHPDDRCWAVDFCVAQTNIGKDHEFEYRMLAADGRTVWLRDIVRVVPGPDGTPSRLRGIMIDVTRRRTSEQRLAAQHAVANVLAHVGSLDEAAPMLLEAIGSNVGWELGAFWQVDAATQRLRVAGLWQSPGLEAPEFGEATARTSFRKGEGFVGRVWSEGAPLWLNDIPTNPSYMRAPFAKTAGLHTAVAFPVVAAGQVIGILEFLTRDRLGRETNLEEALSGLGAQIGLFVERGDAQRRLRDSNAHRGAILSASLDCIITIDRWGVVKEWNEAAEQTFGVPRTQAVGRPMADLIIPPDEREAHLRGMTRYLETGEARLLGRRVELTAQRSDGTLFPCELAIVKLPGDEPLFTGFLRDITERKASEAALEQSEARYRSLAESLPVQVWTARPDGKLSYVNGRVREYAGFTGDRLVEDGWHALVHPDDLDRVVPRWMHSLETGEPYEIEFRIRAADGTYRWHIVRALPQRDSSGTIVGWYGTNTDTDDLKLAHAALAESEHRYVQLLDALPDLVHCRDASGRLLYANKPAVAFSGKTLQELRADDTITEDDANVFRTGQTLEIPDEVRTRANGEERMFHTIKTPVLDTQGMVTQVVSVSRDVTERRQAEARRRQLLLEIEQQRRRLDSIVESVPGVVWEAWGAPTSKSQRIDFVSEYVETMLGYSREEWLSTPNFWLKITHPEDRERVAAESLAAFEAGAGKMQFRWVAKDGRDVWVLGQTVVTYDTNGKPVGTRGVALDISDRIHAEDALRERAEELAQLTEELQYQRQLFQTITDNAGSALFMIDGEGKPIFMNPAACEMTGYESMDEIKDEPLHDAVHFRRPDGSPYPMEDCPIDQANEKIVPLKNQREVFCKKDGTLFPVEYNVAPVTRDEKQLGAVLEVRNISNELAREEALQDQTRTLATINRVNASLAGELDLEKLVQAVTDAGTEVTGADFGAFFYNVENDAGESYMLYSISGVPREAFSKFPQPRATELFAPTFRGEGIIRVDDVTKDARYGKMAPHHGMPKGHLPVKSYLATPVISRSGRVLGGLFFGHAKAGVFTEQTETLLRGIANQAAIAVDNANLYREANMRANELKQMAEALKRSNGELDQFAYVTSHDLKAPLRGIANLSRWIEEDLAGKLDEETKRNLDLLRGRVNRMEGLIEGILEYSRIGRKQVQSETVDVGDMIDEMRDLLAPPPTYEVVVEGKMPTLVTERGRLQQVLMNLVGNAIKHGGPEGKATLRCEDEGDTYRFSVQDDGPGIAPRYHSKVFAIFQTLEARDKVEGTGVGLALVKKIVENQGGTVTLESDEGQGATFTFTWPKQPKGEKTND